MVRVYNEYSIFESDRWAKAVEEVEATIAAHPDNEPKDMSDIKVTPVFNQYSVEDDFEKACLSISEAVIPILKLASRDTEGVKQALQDLKNDKDLELAPIDKESVKQVLQQVFQDLKNDKDLELAPIDKESVIQALQDLMITNVS